MWVFLGEYPVHALRHPYRFAACEKMGTYMGIFNFFIVIRKCPGSQHLALSPARFSTAGNPHVGVGRLFPDSGCTERLLVEDYDDVYR